jgi:hypothetical protein
VVESLPTLQQMAQVGPVVWSPVATEKCSCIRGFGYLCLRLLREWPSLSGTLVRGLLRGRLRETS